MTRPPAISPLTPNIQSSQILLLCIPSMSSIVSKASQTLLALLKPQNRTSTPLSLALLLLLSSSLLWAALDFQAWLAYGFVPFLLSAPNLSYFSHFGSSGACRTGGFDPTLSDYWFMSKIRLRRAFTRQPGRDPAPLLKLAKLSPRGHVRFLNEKDVPARKGSNEGVRPRMRSRFVRLLSFSSPLLPCFPLPSPTQVCFCSNADPSPIAKLMHPKPSLPT